MTPTTASLTVTLSGRRPVRIVPVDWDVVSKATRREEGAGPHCLWTLTVRRHVDGRRVLVYGVALRPGFADRRRGVLLEGASWDGIAAAVRQVAGELARFDHEAEGLNALAEQCLAQCPAEAL
jgi:hypothetical protein